MTDQESFLESDISAWVKHCWTVLGAACQCHFTSVLRQTGHSFVVKKKLSMKNPEHLSDSWNGWCFPKVVCHLSFSVVHLGTYNSLSDSFTSCVTATLNFVFMEMREGYFQDGLASNCSLFPLFLAQRIAWTPWLEARTWGIWITQCADVVGPWVSLCDHT